MKKLGKCKNHTNLFCHHHGEDSGAWTVQCTPLRDENVWCFVLFYWTSHFWTVKILIVVNIAIKPSKFTKIFTAFYSVLFLCTARWHCCKTSSRKVLSVFRFIALQRQGVEVELSELIKVKFTLEQQTMRRFCQFLALYTWPIVFTNWTRFWGTWLSL